MLDDTSDATADAKESATEGPAASEPRQTRIGRSETPFPYVHLEEAITIPRAIFENGARDLSRDQLAGALGVAPGSGSFSLKLGSARMFGLAESNDGRYALTDIGHMACSADTTEAQTGRRDAFLSVELYKRLFTDYRGKPLPPLPKALETALVSYGVAPKQADKCRQTLMRSAQFAGFFANGRDRLIEPIIGGIAPVSRTGSIEQQAVERVDSEAKKSSAKHELAVLNEPLIMGMLVRMPEPGNGWSQEKRAQWLTLFGSVLDMVYPVSAGLLD
jgi:hypothetical protein